MLNKLLSVHCPDCDAKYLIVNRAVFDDCLSYHIPDVRFCAFCGTEFVYTVPDDLPADPWNMEGKI